ncbi:MAG: 30S ribosomal protein S20 [Myxococcales bacterium]|nr:MAG: 30S ribosomal protein S20 [Myxococcales bacterium]
MANHKSAEKRHRQSLKRREQNRHVRSTVRSFTKAVREAVEQGDSAAAQTAFARVARSIDMAVSKGVFHRKTGSRYISRLHTKVAALN